MAKRHKGLFQSCRAWLPKSKVFWISALVLSLGILSSVIDQLPKLNAESFQQFSVFLSVSLHPLLASVSRHLPAWVPIWRISRPDGVIDRRLPSVSELEQDAHHILPLLDNLKQHTFFRIFKIDLSKECPFWARQDMCTSPGSCHICECNDDQIPTPWKMKPIKNFVDRHHYSSEGDIKPWGVKNKATIMEEDEEESETSSKAPNRVLFARPNVGLNGRNYGLSNGLTVSDEHSSTASYVDLTLNRPGYTAYRGRNIWGLIYKENCDFSNPLKENSTRVDNVPPECTEEEAFYKIISGMQSLIMILSAEYHDSRKPLAEHLAEIEELKKSGRVVHASTFKNWYKPDLTLFKTRIAGRRDWIENLYFTFGILLKTFCHVSPILETCDCDTGTPEDDTLACNRLRLLLNEKFNVCQDKYRDEPLFIRKQSLVSRQFKNISRIMDCLECEKCRLHGQVKMLALQLALKASGRDAKIRKIERNEVIAMVNALEYFADGIASLHRFDQRLAHLKLIWAIAAGVVVTGIAVGIQCFGIKKKRRKRNKED